MTSMTPSDIDNLGILDPDYMRQMGEPESSIEYQISRPREPSLLALFGEALRPMTAAEAESGFDEACRKADDAILSPLVAHAMNLPAVDTGD